MDFVAMGRQAVVLLLALSTAPALADSAEPSTSYRIQAGDVLQLSVWHEPDLTKDVLVLPDGWVSLPLVGEVRAAGATVADLRQQLTQRLSAYIPDPTVTVSVLQPAGNKIYVLGKVNRPGEFAVVRPVDVLQALSMAGGMARFAALDRILILRRDGANQLSMSFDYEKVADGDNLEQNVVLRAGDVVIVP